MKKIYFTIGPTQLFPTVSHHIKMALKKDYLSISHRSRLFQTIFKETSSNIRQLLDIPKNYHLFFLSSSLEAMERIIENTVCRFSFHLVNGAFSEKFYLIAKELRKSATKKSLRKTSDYQFSNLKIPKETELICITQNETSQGIAIDPKEIERIKKIHPDKLIAVDIVSSAPYPKINFKFIDMAFFSVQKGFGLPAGLSVLVANEKSIEKSKYLQKSNKNIGSYHNFIHLANLEKIYQTPETPNTFLIYLLGKVAGDMIKIGIEKIRNKIEAKAQMIYKYFDRHSSFHPLISEKKLRSKTTITIDVKGNSKKIVRYLEKRGIIIGAGYGSNKNDHIRIGNFPAQAVDDFKKLISSFENLPIGAADRI